MKRRLRIAVSVFFALVAAAFAVLWVRSYWRVDMTWWSAGSRNTIVLTVSPGQITAQNLVAPTWSTRKRISYAISDLEKNKASPVAVWPRGFGLTPNGFTIPLWMIVVICAAISGVPWIKWSSRYTLRTMLIATTLVAVVLGLAVGAGR